VERESSDSGLPVPVFKRFNWPYDSFFVYHGARGNRMTDLLGAVRNSALLCCFAIFCLTYSAFAATPSKEELTATRLNLHSGWELQSACELGSQGTSSSIGSTAGHSGEAISSSTYRPAKWMATTVPNTIVAAQVEAGLIKDLFYGDNIRKLPGVDYPQGGLFSNLAMRDSSPYHCGWWYRTQFRVPASFVGPEIALHLDGVNYRADIWLNGKRVASREEVAGPWTVFEFSISNSLLPGKENTLAIEVFPPTPDDLAMTWVDWNPDPPDKNTGLFRDVYLTASRAVVLRFPFVSSRLNDSFTTAQLSPTVEAWNVTSRQVNATITWDLEGKSIRQEIALGAHEKKTVSFVPQQFPELTLQNPRLWWPAQLGEPALYKGRVSAIVEGQLSETHDVQFGIRQVTSELNNNHLLFKINGKPILIRGGGWAPDMLLRYTPQRMETEFRYVLDLGLNTIRLEGKLERQEFYDMADKYGVLVMAGWTCCNMWERWNEWGPEQYKIAEASQRDQLRLLRNHPSVLVWLNGSDNPPPIDVEKMYLAVGKEVSWPNPFLSSASATPTQLTGPSGVKMTGPYDYVPPNYWLLDKTAYGGAWGFNTETSPGPAIPVPESLRKFIPADKLWPQNEVWGVHEGGERFQTITAYNTSLEKRYGPPKDLADFLRKAYAMDYEGERAMFEAYARNKYTSTGVIQWMLNNAWPSLIWHLYDYYLTPAGGYYGTKKANGPVHVLYSYSDHAVVLVSENGRPQTGVIVKATLYNLDASPKWSQQSIINVTPDAPAVAFTVPSPTGLSTTYFLKLAAFDGNGKLLSDNFYWLSTKSDELDWTATHDTVYTPQSAYADMTGLETLPQATVRVHSQNGTTDCVSSGPATSRQDKGRPLSLECDGSYQTRLVTISNPGTALAFMVHLRLVKSDGNEVFPTFWDDNYISLLPGESRAVSIRYPASALPEGSIHLQIDGWNLPPQTLPMR
jgi:exo-1,4-beta-D-glucosaminidase